MHADFTSWSLIYLDLLLRETCCILVNALVKFNLLYSFLCETCRIMFFQWKMMQANFCSWKLLLVGYIFKKFNVSWCMSSIKLFYFYFFFMKLIACYSFSSWNLYIDFSSCETGFVHGICCLMIFCHKT